MRTEVNTLEADLSEKNEKYHRELEKLLVSKDIIEAENLRFKGQRDIAERKLTEQDKQIVALEGHRYEAKRELAFKDKQIAALKGSQPLTEIESGESGAVEKVTQQPLASQNATYEPIPCSTGSLKFVNRDKMLADPEPRKQIIGDSQSSRWLDQGSGPTRQNSNPSRIEDVHRRQSKKDNPQLNQSLSQRSRLMSQRSSQESQPAKPEDSEGTLDTPSSHRSSRSLWSATKRPSAFSSQPEAPVKKARLNHHLESPESQASSKLPTLGRDKVQRIIEDSQQKHQLNTSSQSTAARPKRKVSTKTKKMEEKFAKHSGKHAQGSIE